MCECSGGGGGGRVAAECMLSTVEWGRERTEWVEEEMAVTDDSCNVLL